MLGEKRYQINGLYFSWRRTDTHTRRANRAIMQSFDMQVALRNSQSFEKLTIKLYPSFNVYCVTVSQLKSLY